MKPTITRRRGKLPSPPLDAPHKSTIGGADWAAEQLFGSTAKCMELIGAVAEGSQDERWLRAVALWAEWNRRWAEGQLVREPSLNCLCSVLKIPVADFLETLQRSVVEVWGKLAGVKASLAASEIVDYAIMAAADGVNGFKDRQMLLEIARVTGSKAGIQVNVNQQVGLSVSAGERERRLTPLLQFSETIEELDEGLREGISQRALMPADLGEEIEGEIIEADLLAKDLA